MREGQHKSWIVRLLLSFLREAPHHLFAVGMLLWYTHGDIPYVFTAVRYIAIEPYFNTQIIDVKDYLGHISGIILSMVIKIYYCDRNSQSKSIYDEKYGRYY